MDNQMQISRFATWMSTFPAVTGSAIRLHEIAWMHLEPAQLLSSPPLERLLFSYILRGEGQMRLAGKLYSFQRGDVILFDMRESAETSALSSGIDFLSIQMSSALADMLYNYINTENGIVLSGEPELLAIAEQIYTLANGKWSSRSDIEISAALYRLLGLLHTCSPGESQTEEAVAWIQAHYMEELPVEDLATCCRMSLYHFIRCFKRDTGMTPHAYIRQFRIKKAEELLIRTDFPVSAIASLVGYNDSSHFASLFSASVGCLPREYRKLFCK